MGGFGFTAAVMGRRNFILIGADSFSEGSVCFLRACKFVLDHALYVVN